MSESSVNLELAAELDLMAAEELRRQLLDGLGKSGSLELDASSVERISTPCIQVILACDRSVRRSGGSMTVTNPTETFTSAFDRLGLGKCLESWRN